MVLKCFSKEMVNFCSSKGEQQATGMVSLWLLHAGKRLLHSSSSVTLPLPLGENFGILCTCPKVFLMPETCLRYFAAVIQCLRSLWRDSRHWIWDRISTADLWVQCGLGIKYFIISGFGLQTMWLYSFKSFPQLSLCFRNLENLNSGYTLETSEET